MTSQPDALERLERHLGWLLTAGVTTSAVFLTLGLILLMAAPGPWADHLLAAGPDHPHGHADAAGRGVDRRSMRGWASGSSS